MERKSRVGAIIGAFISLIVLALDVSGRLRTAQDILSGQAPVITWLGRVVLSTWGGALVAFGSLIAYRWTQHRELQFIDKCEEVTEWKQKYESAQSAAGRMQPRIVFSGNQAFGSGRDGFHIAGDNDSQS